MSAKPIHRTVANNGTIYEVQWSPVSNEVYIVNLGPGWAPIEGGVATHIGHATSESEAIKLSEIAAYEKLTAFEKYVGGTTLGKSEVIAVHLFLEHLLVRCLYAVLPAPDSLFRDRNISFSLLISLCEAHRILDADYGHVLRKINALRNKCAHKLVFHPSTSDLREVREGLKKITPIDSLCEDAETDPWPIICEILERRAIELGATDI